LLSIRVVVVLLFVVEKNAQPLSPWLWSSGLSRCDLLDLLVVTEVKKDLSHERAAAERWTTHEKKSK